MFHQKTKPVYQVALEDFVLVRAGFLQRFRRESASFGTTSPYCRTVSLRPNYAIATQRTTSHVLGFVCWVFLFVYLCYFVNIVLNSNAEVLKGFVPAKGACSFLMKGMVINFNSIKISHLKPPGWTQTKRKEILQVNMINVIQ